MACTTLAASKAAVLATLAYHRATFTVWFLWKDGVRKVKATQRVLNDEQALATARTKRALSMIALQLTTMYQRIVGKAFRTLVKFSADSSKAELEEEHAQALEFWKAEVVKQRASAASKQPKASSPQVAATPARRGSETEVESAAPRSSRSVRWSEARASTRSSSDTESAFAGGPSVLAPRAPLPSQLSYRSLRIGPQ